MTTADFHQTAAIFARPQDVAELARVLWQAWSDGKRDGRNEMVADERVEFRGKREEKSV